MPVAFRKVHGRVVPIRQRVGRVLAGAAKDTAGAVATGTLVNMVLLKHPLKSAVRGSLPFAAAWGGLSLAVRGGMAINRSRRK